MENKHLLKNATSFKKYWHILLMVLAGITFSLQVQANGGIGPKAVRINVNGTHTWYNVHNPAWEYNPCGDYSTIKSATNFSGANLGSVTLGNTLQISGYALIGWTDAANDYVSGKLDYKIWRQGDSEPGSWSTINVGRYDNCMGSATQVVCTSGNDRVVGYNNGTTDLRQTVAGTYNFKVKGFGRAQWYNGSACGNFNANDGSELTATFTVVAINDPSSPTVSVSGTTATLGWSKNAQSNDVMIVRYAKGASVTAPTQGTTYTAGNSIGSGTVVYRGNATSTTDVITAGNEYDYYFYSENWSYYSTGTVKVTFENPTVTTPTVTSPTATSIAATSATLGANVTSNGGVALTARGTVWGTSPSPTGNSVAEGGTTTGIFSHSRTGLTANTLYYYRGYATNSVGTSYSADGTFTTLPAAPTVGAGTGAAANSFTANWSHPTQGAASYTYEIQVSTNNSTWLPVAFSATGIASANTSTSVTGLTQGQTYYFRVRATNATGSGEWSASSAGVTTTSPCTPPANVTISGGATQCGGTVTLTATGGAGGTIYWQTAADGTSTANGSGTSKEVSATGTWYARSYNSADGGCWGNISNSQTVTINTVPVAPTTTNGSRCGTGTVNLSASQPSGSNTNRWYAASEGGAVLATNTTYTTPSISSTTTYYVSAYHSTTGCESAARTAVTATVNSTPSQPSVITGETTPLPGATEGYSVTNVGGVSYAWTFPSGWTQVSGGTTDSITVEVGSGSGSISVTPSVGGCSGIPRTLAVAPLAAPTITSLTADVCDNDFTSFGSMYVSANGYLAGESFTGTYSYQWQKYNTGTSSWDNYTDGLGATTNNIRPPFSGDYRCIVTRDSVSVASNTVTLAAAGCLATTVSSNLPVVIISTSGQGFPVKCSGSEYWSQCIPNPNNITPSPDVKTKINADVKILWDGTASDTDGLITQSDINNATKVHYDRKARVNYRGSSSMNFTKKSYAIVTGEPNVKDNGEYKKVKPICLVFRKVLTLLGSCMLLLLMHL